ncbi:hypothetical protein [Nocardia sp. NPDC051570]
MQHPCADLPDWLGTADLDRTLASLADPAIRLRFAEETNPTRWR